MLVGLFEVLVVLGLLLVVFSFGELGLWFGYDGSFLGGMFLDVVFVLFVL